MRLLSISLLTILIMGSDPIEAQVPTAPPRPPRSTPPTRDPNTPGYVTAKDLPDGANAPANADGNFILGPTHNPAPEVAVQEGVAEGTVLEVTMEATDSKLYPGIAREPNTCGKGDTDNSAKM